MWFQIWHDEFGEFSLNHAKVWKFYFHSFFLSKVYEVWAKKYRGVIFHDTGQWYKIWKNPDLLVSKMAWGIEWTFIRALKSLKNCTLMGSFCSKHIIFQLEHFRGITCHGTKRWLEKWQKEFGLSLCEQSNVWKRNLVNFHTSSWK